MTTEQDELVSRVAPAWAWEVIDQTLELDSRSIAVDRETRQNIKEAYEAMTEDLECVEF